MTPPPPSARKSCFALSSTFRRQPPWKVLDLCRHCHPVILGRFPNRDCRRCKAGVVECANSDPIVVRADIKFPTNSGAAVGTEIIVRASPARARARISFVVPFQSHIGNAEVSVGREWNSASPLAISAVADIDDCRVPRNDRAKFLTLALRYPLHAVSSVDPT